MFFLFFSFHSFQFNPFFFVCLCFLFLFCWISGYFSLALSRPLSQYPEWERGRNAKPFHLGTLLSSRKHCHTFSSYLHTPLESLLLVCYRVKSIWLSLLSMQLDIDIHSCILIYMYVFFFSVEVCRPDQCPVGVNGSKSQINSFYRWYFIFLSFSPLGRECGCKSFSVLVCILLWFTWLWC